MIIRIIYFVFLSFLIFSDLFSQIRIVSTEEPPTNFTIGYEFTGTTTEIVRDMIILKGMDVDIEVLPWARSYNIALKNENVMIYTAGKTKERELLGFHFIGPVITREFALYALTTKKINITAISDIIEQNLVIAGLRGDWRTKYFIDRGVKVKEVNKHYTHYKMLFHDRVDMVISSNIELPVNIKSVGYSTEDIQKVFVFNIASS